MIIALALGAAGVSAYLTKLSISEEKAAGCSADAGCDQVLGSAWSHLAGVPVAALATALYLLIGLTAISLLKAWLPRSRRRLGSLLFSLTLAAAGAGVWFVFLQVARVHAYCPWCLSVHACGFALLLLCVLTLRRQVGSAELERPSVTRSNSSR